MSDPNRMHPEGYQPNAIERASLPLLVRLSAMPRWLFMALLATLLILGLALYNPIGGVLLLVLAGFLCWLAAIGWSLQSLLGKLLRIAVVVLLVIVALPRFVA